MPTLHFKHKVALLGLCHHYTVIWLDCRVAQCQVTTPKTATTLSISFHVSPSQVLVLQPSPTSLPCLTRPVLLTSSLSPLPFPSLPLCPFSMPLMSFIWSNPYLTLLPPSNPTTPIVPYGLCCLAHFLLHITITIIHTVSSLLPWVSSVWEEYPQHSYKWSLLVGGEKLFVWER